MQTEPEKKRDAESSALETFFFKDASSDVESFRAPVVDYRLFSNVGATLDENAIAPLRAELLRHTQKSICHDIACLLRAKNWRFHALASGAVVLAPERCSEVAHLLWMRVRLGCAMVAQLSAAAAATDTDFKSKAQRLLKLSSTSEQSIAALSALLFWIDCQSELPRNPRAAAEGLSRWGAVGSNAVACHSKYAPLCGLTPRSSGAPTAGHQGPA